MLFEADKVMFEIYRETEYTGKYRVVLLHRTAGPQQRDRDQSRAGRRAFLRRVHQELPQGRGQGDHRLLLGRLNNGEKLDAQEVERALGDHLA